MSIEIRGERRSSSMEDLLHLRAVRVPHPDGPEVIGEAWVDLHTRELTDITILPAYRRMGIATQLVIAASRKIVQLSHHATGISGLWVAPAMRSPEFGAWRASLPLEMQRTHPVAAGSAVRLPTVVGFTTGTTAGGLS